MEIILATANYDKVREIREILPDSQISFLTMHEAGFHGKIEENGHSFAQNALIKARTVHNRTGGYVLADDSGLAVAVLDGAPGILSARFAGENAGYPEKIACLHEMLQPWPPDLWQASFICVIALICPDGRELTFRGECSGMIASKARGVNGFGYDPIFYLPEYGKTMAELPPEVKHQISHRGRALRAAADFIQSEPRT